MQTFDDLIQNAEGVDVRTLVWHRMIVGNSSKTERRRVRHIDDPYHWDIRFDLCRQTKTKRLMLWNPFGSTGVHQPMRFEFVLDAIREREWNLLRIAEPAAKWLGEDDGRRLVMYVGSPERHLGDVSGADIIKFCMDLYLFDERVEIAFDAASSQGVDSRVCEWAYRLRDAGRTVWVEALPFATEEHWHGFGMVCIDRFLRNQLRVGYPRVQPADMRESVCFMTGHDDNPLFGNPDPSLPVWDQPDNVFASSIIGVANGFGIGIEQHHAEKWEKHLP